MIKNIFIFSFVLGLMAVSTNAVAQDNAKSTSEATVTETTADDKATHTDKKSGCAGKASAEAGKKACCASKASASTSAKATAQAVEGDAAKKACCADGKKKDCKGKGAKAEAPAKDI